MAADENKRLERYRRYNRSAKGAARYAGTTPSTPNGATSGDRSPADASRPSATRPRSTGRPRVTGQTSRRPSRQDLAELELRVALWLVRIFTRLEHALQDQADDHGGE